MVIIIRRENDKITLDTPDLIIEAKNKAEISKWSGNSS